MESSVSSTVISKDVRVAETARGNSTAGSSSATSATDGRGENGQLQMSAHGEIVTENSPLSRSLKESESSPTPTEPINDYHTFHPMDELVAEESRTKPEEPKKKVLFSEHKRVREPIHERLKGQQGLIENNKRIEKFQRFDSSELTSASLSPPSLLQEAVECLAQSNLIFLLANLRLLSATGRLYTKFEAVNIDSDFVRKYSALHLTGGAAEAHWRGISPAQTMAVLLINLRKEIINSRKGRADHCSPSGLGASIAEESLHHKEDSLLSTMIDPQGRKETANNMDKALNVSIAMLGRDLKISGPEISGEDLIGRMRSFIIRERHQSLKHRRQLSSLQSTRLDPSIEEDNTDTSTTQKSMAESKNWEWLFFGNSVKFNSPNITNKQARQQSIFQNVQEKVAEVVDKVPLSEEAKHRQKLENLVTDFFGVAAENIRDSVLNRNLTEAELMNCMERAVESRNYEESLFMADFFKEGTVSRALVQSKSKVVWLNDWYPLKDLTYAISIDEDKRRVMVVFRGAITASDWGAAVDSKFQKTRNPIKDNYSGKQEFLKLHRGFFLYLFRQRKDTETCKYDEIARTVHRYGNAIGEDYKLFVTGHSLGGALATIFSFFASTEDRFTQNGPVKCITFGAPMVGGYAFAEAFRHQERSQKLMLARFHNRRDLGKNTCLPR